MVLGENSIYIKGYEELYIINTDGEIYAMPKSHTGHHGCILKGRIGDSGYVLVNLSKNGKSETCRVHRLVAEHFIKNPCNLPEVNHISGKKQNNKVSNLEWVTSSQNKQHALRIGLIGIGEESPVSKLSEKDVILIREIYDSGLKTMNELGKRFRVNPGTIWAIVNRKSWAHI